MMLKFIVYKLAFIFILSLVGCGNMFTKNKTKFHWLATESAPKNYPMRIINGTFYYHNEKGGLYVPTAAAINPHWGTGRSTHVVGEDFKPLPDRLDIRFFSFTENKLYQGSFDLPYEKILALFREGVARDKDRPTFNTIMAGVAPGGIVSVWLTGRETREVFFGQAEPYEDDLFDITQRKINDRDDYVRRNIIEMIGIEKLTDIEKNGVPLGLWEKYRTPYKWSPIFKTEKKMSTYLSLSFFNGENYRFDYPLNKNVMAKGRPLPLLISFGCYIEGTEKQYFFTVRFDEKELYAAFDKLGGTEELVNIEIEPLLPKNLTKVRLYNSKGSIELKHYKSEM
ncbi:MULTISPECIES: DUF2931 family protein [unclassified Cellvibrio]|uniref:DUF2931 family protein n=1 Tax=unclassified Cellvibrio TaxID=2624793 RepID=UPI0005907D4F|nr:MULTISPECIES: DUF2931 family protein [unclassified Cellvibrio]UUA75096.1 DUF2931 family protein [Cellvibrio sp. QJXJ]